jgi:hypothetical protein
MFPKKKSKLLPPFRYQSGRKQKIVTKQGDKHEYFWLSGNRRGWAANVGQDGSLSHGGRQIWGCAAPIPNEPYF